MKHWFSIIYWLSAALVIAFVLISVGYSFGSALFIGVLFIPAAFAAKRLLPQIHFERGLRNWLWPFACMVVGLVVAQYCIIFVANYFLFKISVDAYPPLMHNPVFISIMLIIFIVPEKLISSRFKKRDTHIDFFCNRRKVRVEIDEISYLESNDTEVNIFMSDGTRYRTRTTISTWEKMLDERFVRVHRSFIVNTSQISRSDLSSVTVGGRTIEISRKYRDEARRKLTLE